MLLRRRKCCERWVRNLQLKNWFSEQQFVFQSMEWRVRWDIDRLLTHWEPPLALKQFFPSGVCGNDKDGVPGNPKTNPRHKNVVWFDVFSVSSDHGAVQRFGHLGTAALRVQSRFHPNDGQEHRKVFGWVVRDPGEGGEGAVRANPHRHHGHGPLLHQTLHLEAWYWFQSIRLFLKI